jgi:hypothetical protein
MILKQISKGDNHYLKKQQPSKVLYTVSPFRSIWPINMAAKNILFSDWLMLKKSSPLKQLGQMEPNLA